MDRNEITAKLLEIIRFSDDTAAARCPEIGEQTRILEDLGFSSVAMLYMAVQIEETFGIVLSDVNIWELKTVGDAVRMIEEKTK